MTLDPKLVGELLDELVNAAGEYACWLDTDAGSPQFRKARERMNDARTAIDNALTAASDWTNELTVLAVGNAIADQFEDGFFDDRMVEVCGRVAIDALIVSLSAQEKTDET